MVARACGASFEWTDRIEHARAAVCPTIGDRSGRGTLGDKPLPQPYATAAPVIRAALAWQDVPDAAQSAAVATFGMKAGFVELVVVAGFHQMFSAINQGFDVTPPAGSKPAF